MTKDLPGFNNEVIGFGAGVFFIGYLLLEIPGTLLVERWSARQVDQSDHDLLGDLGRADGLREDAVPVLHGPVLPRAWPRPGSSPG